MPSKKELVGRLMSKPTPRNFTVRDLDTLMSKCNCEKYQGGRGSGIGYRHLPTNRAVQFDSPHPGKELYTYQVKAVIAFLKSVGEI
ncbi:MAG: type II toxin-antitoxin system HicA family toxin [Oscillospiraceae bacterium]|nr:type II toxin-antitoxin system HicA family toxin [Oscillospiraceae bacterium]